MRYAFEILVPFHILNKAVDIVEEHLNVKDAFCRESAINSEESSCDNGNNNVNSGSDDLEKLSKISLSPCHRSVTSECPSFT
ncbi:hypothetical protein CEXT_683301 [Caerostris extrusa]|uniref:Uncharacterized protein n=1 Tax=Caerostris extrusa TaxID=172846 RepID=A0AAV4V8V2_CAEEX|nr:hypothetical protein CEXT_683301 [Caerostris extrusa]